MERGLSTLLKSLSLTYISNQIDLLKENNHYMKSILIIIGLIIVPAISYSQEVENTNKNLREQYQELKETTETYNQYKVIPENRLDGWFKTIQDSISDKSNRINSLLTSTTALKDTISDLRNEKSQMQTELDEGDFEKSHIGVLGVNFTKAAYIGITFILIIGLSILIILFVIKVIDTGKTTRDTIKLHDTLTAEFEEYKRRALEKQTKLARDLQTERNRIDEIRRKR